MLYKARIISLLAVALVLGCEPDQAEEFANPEPAFRAEYDAKTIILRGTVVDAAGTPIEGATVTIGGRTNETDTNGSFEIDGIKRHSTLLTVSHTDMFTETRFAWLHQPKNKDAFKMEPIVLQPDDADTVRLFFGGDVSMGRRFLATDPPIDRVPKDEPGTLIRPSEADTTTRNVLKGVKPYLDYADFVSVNLETVVTDEPYTPYSSKPYVFFTMPESIDALQWWGVDYVAQGNNHIWDYFEDGMADTLNHVNTRELGHSGAGRTEDEAFTPYETTIAGEEYSFISASSIDGSQYDTLFVAEPGKGGGANAWDSMRFGGVIRAAKEAGRIPIVNLHTGAEYTELPTSTARGRMQFAIDNGALLTIAHHPHVPQGLELYKDGFIAHSLGNLVFDQNRLETVLGLSLYVDLKDGKVQRVQGLPVYLENYIPRAVGAAVADAFLRRIAAASASVNTNVGVYQGRAWVQTELTPLRREDREIEIAIQVNDDGTGYVDMRQFAESDESITAIKALGLTGQFGRDLMVFGDMEDLDADDDTAETSRWWYSGEASFPCLHASNRGTVAMCSWRTQDNRTPATIAFRNRIRVLGNPTDTPNKDLTFLGYFGGSNAGQVSVEVRYYAPMGEVEFGKENVWTKNITGDMPFTPTWTPLNMPADDPNNPTSREENARALRVWVSHEPPKDGGGMFRMDDLAIISWDPALTFDETYSVSHHHPNDYVRFNGAPGTHRIQVTVSRFVPASVPIL